MPRGKPIKFTVEDIRPHFEKPLRQAAEDLGVSVTLLKRLCRRFGIPRWPFRTLRGLDKIRKSGESPAESSSSFGDARIADLVQSIGTSSPKSPVETGQKRKLPDRPQSSTSLSKTTAKKPALDNRVRSAPNLTIAMATTTQSGVPPAAVEGVAGVPSTKMLGGVKGALETVLVECEGKMDAMADAPTARVALREVMEDCFFMPYETDTQKIRSICGTLSWYFYRMSMGQVTHEELRKVAGVLLQMHPTRSSRMPSSSEPDLRVFPQRSSSAGPPTEGSSDVRGAAQASAHLDPTSRPFPSAVSFPSVVQSANVSESPIRFLPSPLSFTPLGQAGRFGSTSQPIVSPLKGANDSSASGSGPASGRDGLPPSFGDIPRASANTNSWWADSTTAVAPPPAQNGVGKRSEKVPTPVGEVDTSMHFGNNMSNAPTPSLTSSFGSMSGVGRQLNTLSVKGESSSSIPVGPHGVRERRGSRSSPPLAVHIPQYSNHTIQAVPAPVRSDSNRSAAHEMIVGQPGYGMLEGKSGSASSHSTPTQKVSFICAGSTIITPQSVHSSSSGMKETF